MVDKDYVHTLYMDNIGLKKGKSSGSKQKEYQDTSKEGKIYMEMDKG